MNRKIVNKKIVWSCFLLFSVIGLTAFATGTLSEKNMPESIVLSGNGCYSEQDILAAWGWEGRKPEEIEEYTGVYLDGQKNIVLMLLESSKCAMKEETTEAYADAAKRLEEYRGVPKFILQPAKYNAATLSAVQDYLVKTAYSRETVRNMGVDVKNNRIEIGILPSGHLEEDKEFLYSLLEDIEGVEVERDILSFHDATGENYELRINIVK